MRAALFVLSISVFCAAGCQSGPYQATPIVGDSMTIGSGGFPQAQGPVLWDQGTHAGPFEHGYSTGPPSAWDDGGWRDDLSDTSCVDENYADGMYPSMEGCTRCADPGCPMGAPGGCAGGFCDGRCQGLCRQARESHAQRMAMLRMKHEEIQRYLASRPIKTHVLNTATRHCEGAVGPQFGGVNYPYYTTRGPRDFLMANPAGIGP